jgi:hypothetical protein
MPAILKQASGSRMSRFEKTATRVEAQCRACLVNVETLAHGIGPSRKKKTNGGLQERAGEVARKAASRSKPLRIAGILQRVVPRQLMRQANGVEG